MKLQKKLSEIVSYNKGQQINGDLLLEKGDYDYLNGGIFPSGKWNNFNVEGNTITISEGGNSCGYVNYMTNKFWCGAHCYYLYNSKLQPKYLFYLLKSQQERLMKIRTGACMPNIKKTDLGNFVIEYDDDISVQNKIIKIFDILNKIITVRNKQLTDLDLLVKSRFVEMFGDPIINNKNWAKKKLSDECEIITGNTPSRQRPEYYGDYIEWIKSDNINTPNAILTKAVEYLSEKGLEVGRVVDAGAILMTCIAGSISCIGNIAIADRKVAFNQQINGIVPNKNNTWFLYIMFELSKRMIQSSINMSLKGILSKGQLSEMEFIFPPLALQNQFAAFVEKVDQTKASIKKSLEQFETLKKKLMQDYFG